MIAGSGQALRLLHDGCGVFVTQKNESDGRHSGKTPVKNCSDTGTLCPIGRHENRNAGNSHPTQDHQIAQGGLTLRPMSYYLNWLKTNE
jgi:hypothetical protein